MVFHEDTKLPGIDNQQVIPSLPSSYLPLLMPHMTAAINTEQVTVVDASDTNTNADTAASGLEGYQQIALHSLAQYDLSVSLDAFYWATQQPSSGSSTSSTTTDPVSEERRQLWGKLTTLLRSTVGTQDSSSTSPAADTQQQQQQPATSEPLSSDSQPEPADPCAFHSIQPTDLQGGSTFLHIPLKYLPFQQVAPLFCSLIYAPLLTHLGDNGTADDFILVLSLMHP